MHPLKDHRDGRARLVIINHTNRFDVFTSNAAPERPMQSHVPCLSFIDAVDVGAGVRRPIIAGTPFN